MAYQLPDFFALARRWFRLQLTLPPLHRSHPRSLKISLVVAALAIALPVGWASFHTKTNINTENGMAASLEVPLSVRLDAYLTTKKSPLAGDSEYILTLKHWRLLLAISAIESQFCIHQIDYNCWGVGGDSAYRHYSSFRAALVDADALIEKWQAKGRWLTPEDMNCSYVVPCSDNWVRVVHKTLLELPN